MDLLLNYMDPLMDDTLQISWVPSDSPPIDFVNPLVDSMGPLIDAMDPLRDAPYTCHDSPYRLNPFIDLLKITWIPF